MKNKKEKLVVILLVVGLIVMTVAISYAAFRFTQTGSVLNQITTGSITMSYTESSNVISMTGALPTTDATGKTRLNEGEYFDFTVGSSITGTANINYEIAAQELDGNTIDGSYIKYYLTEVDSTGNETEVMSPKTYTEETTSNEYTGRPSNMMSLYTGSMNASTTVKYRLRLYVDESYNPQGDGGNLVYKTRVNVYGLSGEAIEESITFVPGIYNEDGSLYMSWDELTNQYYIYVGNGSFGWTHYGDNICPGGLFNDKILVVDSSVTSVSVNSFHCEEHLEASVGFSKIVLPDSVTSIDSYTFSNGETVYYSGTAAGSSTWGASEIKSYAEASELGIPTLGSETTTLEAGIYDGDTFYSWKYLIDNEIISIEGSTMCFEADWTDHEYEMFVIDASITRITGSMLSVTDLVIPETITYIDGDFYVEGNVCYMGSEEQWVNVEKSESFITSSANGSITYNYVPSPRELN